MSVFDDWSKKIPDVKKIKLRCEADYYGASKVISNSLHLPFKPKSLSGWRHGWKYLPIQYKSQLLGPNDELIDTFLLANQKQKDMIKTHGKKGYAVGLPFIYANIYDSYNISRILNSLLVMPPHSLPYTHHQFDEDKYVAEIVALQSNFDLIVVCVHHDCFDKKLWVNKFQKAGVQCIVGASADDENALIRMNRIFKSFEYVTTNTMGSHVLYAAYCGCKVSIYGDFFEPTQEEYREDPFYKKNPDLLDFVIKNHKKEKLSLRYPDFFCEPHMAQNKEEWAKKEIGFYEKVSPLKIAFYLGWFSPLRFLRFNLNRIIRRYWLSS